MTRMPGSPNPIRRFGGVREVQRRLNGRSLMLEQHKEAIAGELLAMGFATLADVVTWDKQGNVTVKATEEISDAALRAIKKIKVTRGKEGSETLEIELHDKVRILQTLAKASGIMDTPAQESNAPSVVGIKLVGPGVVETDYEEVIDEDANKDSDRQSQEP